MKAKQLRSGQWFTFLWSGIRARLVHKTLSGCYVEGEAKVTDDGKKLPPARWHISLETEVSECSR